MFTKKSTGRPAVRKTRHGTSLISSYPRVKDLAGWHGEHMRGAREGRHDVDHVLLVLHVVLVILETGGRARRGGTTVKKGKKSRTSSIKNNKGGWWTDKKKRRYGWDTNNENNKMGRITIK